MERKRAKSRFKCEKGKNENRINRYFKKLTWTFNTANSVFVLYKLCFDGPRELFFACTIKFYKTQKVFLSRKLFEMFTRFWCCLFSPSFIHTYTYSNDSPRKRYFIQFTFLNYRHKILSNQNKTKKLNFTFDSNDFHLFSGFFGVKVLWKF